MNTGSKICLILFMVATIVQNCTQGLQIVELRQKVKAIEEELER